MTAIDDRLATVTELRPACRPRPAPAPDDLHARKLAASNRLLKTGMSTELTAQDALGEFTGRLMNTVPKGGSLSEQGLVELLERTAEVLAVPKVPTLADANVAALVDVFMDAEDLLSRIVAAVGDLKQVQGTSREEGAEAVLHSLVEDLAAEYDVLVIA